MMKDNNNQKRDKFLELLEDIHTFPGEYCFKFIFPSKEKKRVEALLEGARLSFKISKKGNYTSVTAIKYLEKAEDVITINSQLGNINGLLAL